MGATEEEAEKEMLLRYILNFPFAVNKRSPISLKRKLYYI
jgi:hypothetical protein